MGFEELLDLLEQDAGVHGLEEQLEGAEFLPISFVDGEGGEEGHGGVIRCQSGRLDDFPAGEIALHAHVGDDHVVLMGT